MFLDLVLDFVMHVNSASPCIALEAALFAGGLSCFAAV